MYKRQQEFEPEQDRAAEASAEELICAAVFLASPANRQEDGQYRAACDDGDTDRIDRRADALDYFNERHAVMVSLSALLLRRHAAALLDCDGLRQVTGLVHVVTTGLRNACGEHLQRDGRQQRLEKR